MRLLRDFFWMKFSGNIYRVFCLALSIGLYSVYGQDMLYNSGVNVHIQEDAFMTVKGDFYNTNNGSFENNGEIFVESDWYNDALNNIFTVNSTGTVIFSGALQTIGGTNRSNFYNLLLEGNSEKRLAIGCEVTNWLDLRDVPFETDIYQIYLTNPEVNSLRWNDGYISSTSLGGGISRSMNKKQAYVFPVGSDVLDDIYRPVVIQPVSTDSVVYSVRLGAVDPDADASGTSLSGAVGPFYSTSKNSDIDKIHTGFYHNIFQSYGNSKADVSIQYFDTDGNFQGVAHWDVTDEWVPTLFEKPVQLTTISSVNTPNREFKYLNFGGFTNDVFALNSDLQKVKIPNIFSPNGDGKDDMFQIVVNEEFVSEYHMIIFDRWGTKIFESSDITEGWDGSFKGNFLNSAVFLYDVDIKFTDQSVEKRTGDIALVR